MRLVQKRAEVGETGLQLHGVRFSLNPRCLNDVSTMRKPIFCWRATVLVSRIPTHPVSQIPLQNLMNPGLFFTEGLESHEFRSSDIRHRFRVCHACSWPPFAMSDNAILPDIIKNTKVRRFWCFIVAQSAANNVALPLGPSADYRRFANLETCASLILI
jgi:hypothetical protein